MTALGATFTKHHRRLNTKRFHDVETLVIPYVPQTASHRTHVIITINHGSGEDMEAVSQYIDKVVMYDVATKYGPTFEDWETFVGETTS